MFKKKFRNLYYTQYNFVLWERGCGNVDLESRSILIKHVNLKPEDQV